MITVKIFFKSFSREQSVLALKACFLLLKKASLLSSKVQVIALPKKTQKFTVLKSPHVNKKSREQFMLQTHKHMLTLNVATSDGFVPPEENLQLKKFLLGLYGISFKGVEIKLTLLTHTYLQKHYE